jgi:UDP-N-acetyl-D-mannosaminuronate dehydrogenase
MTTKIVDVILLAEKYDQKLKANDPRFQKAVVLTHMDGSVMFYRSAFLMRHDPDWIICFTEHHQYKVYETSELKEYCEVEFKKGAVLQELK